ncbi:MAG TPA: ABC transporter permease [Herpetosiphonaceae bacterium]
MSVHKQSLPAMQQDDSVPAVLQTRGISLLESFRIAVDTLMASKLRTFLTMLGIIIGVAAVVALLALGRGAQEQIAESITSNGANLLTVVPGSLRAGGFSQSGGETQSLNMGDVAALADPSNVPDAVLVSPEFTGFGTIVAGSKNTSAAVLGITPTYLQIHNHSLTSGEFINEMHQQGMMSVAVLGSRMATTLFPDQDPIGKTIVINQQYFRVIGVLGSKGGDAMVSTDDSIMIPITTAQLKLFVGEGGFGPKAPVHVITVQARDADSTTQVIAQIGATLRNRHRLPATGDGDDFTVNNQQDVIDTLTQSQRTLTLYLGAIAAISLMVGGIGIMNIMLVSVHQRTREIGVRKAIGARERDILTQFLIEALALSTSGGLLGLLIGIGIAVGAQQTGQARATVTVGSGVLAVSVAMAIGLFFGIEPARRAAQLDPIEALRYE